MSQHARNTAIFSALTLISRITGLLRLAAFTFAIGGRNILADSYQLAYLIPSTIYQFIIGGMLSAVFIPLLVQEQQRSGKTSQEAWKIANLLLGGVCILLAGASFIAFFAATPIIHSLTAMSSGPDAEARMRLATELFRFFTPQILLLGINAVFMAILDSHSVFAITGAIPIANNIVVIACFIAYHYGLLSPYGVAVGTTLGTATMIVIQIPWLLHLGMRIRPIFNLRHPIFKSITKLGAPIACVSVANLLGWAVRSNLLSTVLGAFAIYTICFQIIMMPYGIFAVSIATVLFPALSRHAADGNMRNFVQEMSLGMRWTMFIMLPISIGSSVLALPLIRMLFEHRGGQFSYSDSLFTATFLQYYALSIFPYAILMFATRTFYALKDTVSPAWINIGGVILNAVLSYVLLKIMGASGIALAATISYIVTMVASFIVLKNKIRSLDGRVMIRSALKMGAAVTLMAISVQALNAYMRPDVVVMERASRFALRVPESSARGNVILLNKQSDFQRFWKMTGRDESLIPAVDFDRASIALVIGPASRTTSSLTLKSTKQSPPGTLLIETSVTTGTKGANRSTGTSTTALADMPTSPAYMMLKINHRVNRAELSMRIGPQGKKSSWWKLADAEVLQFALLVLVGAAVYFLTNLLLGTEELYSFGRMIWKKLSRKNPPIP